MKKRVNFQMWLTVREYDYVKGMIKIVRTKTEGIDTIKDGLIHIFNFYGEENSINPFTDIGENPLIVYQNDPDFVRELNYLIGARTQAATIKLQDILDEVKPGWIVNKENSFDVEIRNLIKEVFNVE